MPGQTVGSPLAGQGIRTPMHGPSLWKEPTATRFTRGQFAMMPPQKEGAWYVVVARSSDGADTFHLEQLASAARARTLCEMNGPAVAWADESEMVAQARREDDDEEGSDVWYRRAPDLVQVDYEPAARPPRDMLVAMRSLNTPVGQYVCGFYDHDEERWCQLRSPFYGREALAEPPLGWAPIGDAELCGLTMVSGRGCRHVEPQ